MSLELTKEIKKKAVEEMVYGWYVPEIKKEVSRLLNEVTKTQVQSMELSLMVGENIVIDSKSVFHIGQHSKKLVDNLVLILETDNASLDKKKEK